MEKIKKDNHKSWQHIFLLFLGFLILAAGIGGAVMLVKTKPKAKKKIRVSMIPVVESIALKATDENVIINAMGTVIPAREVSIQSEVSGRIVWISPDFVEGGIVKQGDILVKVDDSDYKLALKKRQAQLEIEESNLQLEEGRQDIARHEWDMLDVGITADESDMALALRKPQLIKQQALVSATRTDMEQSELLLARTEIKAPFDSVISTAAVNVGDQAIPGKVLAQLIGTEQYWIMASVMVEDLKWVIIPSKSNTKGSVAKIILSSGREYEGTVIRQLPDLEARGRMARLLIAVDDPLGRSDKSKQSPILLREYVRIRIQGPEEKGVYRISRNALRNGNELWMLDKNNKLHIVDAKIIWTDKDTLIVQNTWNDGDKLIMTGLGVVVDGMKLRDIKDSSIQKENPTK
jgi:RND family efflux transporter MFP subunit